MARPRSFHIFMSYSSRPFSPIAVRISENSVDATCPMLVDLITHPCTLNICFSAMLTFFLLLFLLLVLNSLTHPHCIVADDLKLSLAVWLHDCPRPSPFVSDHPSHLRPTHMLARAPLFSQTPRLTAYHALHSQSLATKKKCD